MTSATAAMRCLRGTPGAEGFAAGPIVRLDAAPDAAAVSAAGAGTSDAERLQAALDAADAQYARLEAAHGADADAAGIIGFARALLADDALVAPALAAIAGGVSAERAWTTVLDAHIADFAGAGDPYFAARAVDVGDVRDRVIRALRGIAETAVRGDAVVVAADMTPAAFLAIAWNGGGIALLGGSPHSHVATLARARGVPLVVGLDVRAADEALRSGSFALLDGAAGALTIAPDDAARAAFDAGRRRAAERTACERQALARPAMTVDGVAVAVLVNVASLSDLHGLDPAACDGIGLVRTELLVPEDALDEARQFAAYRAVAAWAAGKRVVFRLFDAGADKPMPSLAVPPEPNPFLGTRGVRLLLARPAELQAQLRALARLAASAPVDVMVPMVTLPAELDAVRRALDAALASLAADGLAAARPRLGMMIEVPAAALALDAFDAEFYSIGTNDLIAYLCASARDGAQAAALTDPHQPAVRRIIATIVAAARARSAELSLCGDIAGDEVCLPWLLDAGVRRLSVAPALLARVKSVLSTATITVNVHEEQR